LVTVAMVQATAECRRR